MAKSTSTTAVTAGGEGTGGSGPQGEARDFAFRGGPAPLDPLLKAAICRRRGGWEKATDEEFARLWASLDEEQRAELLKP